MGVARSLLGVDLWTYVTIAHFTQASILACSGGGELRCALVTTSPESQFLGAAAARLGPGSVWS